MKKEILIILVLLTSLISMHAANLTSPPLSIVPRPAQVVPGEGNFAFSSQTLFSVENHEQAVIVRNFINLLKRSSGITPQLAIGGSEKSHVCFTIDSSLKSEAYQLAVTPEQMKKLIEELKPEFDYILLDCPAGIEQGFKNAIAAADRALIVTTPEVSAIRDADRIIGLLEANDIHKINLIVNRLRMDMVKRGAMMSIEDVIDILAIDLIGAVPDDESIVVATNQGEPLAGDSSLAGTAYMNICKRIMGEDVPLMNLDVNNGFFAKLSKLFK